MKILALYLPQFHRVPENDEWWGEGFTEWTAVKRAEKYYEGQVQPRVPLNGNYYDLLDKRTMEWQAELMHQYDVHGMVFYHYWFKDGRKILEKPAENLLAWKDVDMPFCFSWANESWIRTWKNIRQGNAWAPKFEPSMAGSESVLLEQQYGTEKEWIEHFAYLAEFFKDERYIKVDGKPMFIFLIPQSIPCLVKMVSCWREQAKKYGFEDLYLVGTNNDGSGVLDAIMKTEPNTALAKFTKRGYVDSKEVWNTILKEDTKSDVPVYQCGCVGFDNTPRHGKHGLALSLLTPKQFEDYMTKLIAKGRALGNEFVFVNAWNEWGEGMYLEPDEMNGYGMLAALKNALERSKTEPFSFEEEREKADAENDFRLKRCRSVNRTLDQWMSCMEAGKTIGDFLTKKGCHNIAIYGLGVLGFHLINQLENTDIVIDYGIDRRVDRVAGQLPIYEPDAHLPETQLVIVTVMYEYAQIYEKLSECLKCEIVSLDELLGQMQEGERIKAGKF
jgi:hypothetical protein